MLARRLAVVALAIVGLACGCARPEKPLRVGSNVWPGYEPMYLARSLGYLEGHSIRLIELASSAEVIRAYRNGLIEVAALTADETLMATQGQPCHRVVLVCDFSCGADVVLARSELRTLQDLKGKKVGVEGSALGAYVLARALETAGLTAADIVTVQVSLPQHESAFSSGQVDAVVTFEPHRSRLLASGARQLFDSSQIPGEIVDLLLARRELTDSQDRALGALVSGWFRALDHLQKAPSDAAARIAPGEGLKPEEFLQSLRGLSFPDRQANRRLLGSSSSNLSPTFARLTGTMVKAGIIPAPVDPPLLDERFVGSDR